MADHFRTHFPGVASVLKFNFEKSSMRGLKFVGIEKHARIRKCRIVKKTYIAKAESRRHLILVMLTKEQATYEAIDATGVVFDRTVSTP